MTEYQKRYYQEHREEIRIRSKLHYDSDPIFREHRKLRTKEHGKEIKIEVLTHYGRGKLACVSCGEHRVACLSIDHINGNGRQDRKAHGAETGGWVFYNALRRAGFPEGYQTLCMNCQWIKRVEKKE